MRTAVANACDPWSEDTPMPPFVSTEQESVKVVQDSYVFNTSRNKRRAFCAPVTLWVSGRKVHAEALVDSGATTNFINSTFVKKHHLEKKQVAKPLNVTNADGTINTAGTITHYVKARLQLGNHVTEHNLYIINLGDKDMMIGYTYLYAHNPEIDWLHGKWRFTRCPDSCTNKARKIKIEADSDKRLYTFNSALDELGDVETANPFVNWVELEEINDNFMIQAQILERVIRNVDTKEDDDKEDTRLWTTRVPSWVHQFRKVFSKSKSERMPERKEYDHPIDFVEDAKLPPPSKIYPLAPAERDALKDWLKEELRKGYIRPSKSPVAAPFFFVKKSDGGLRPCMDYRKLNEITVRNRYPIPRISDLIDSLSKASIFTKIDLRWGYNNVRIRKGDEWKTAFITRYGLYEAVVMYFGFSNAPATFQNMMNKILEDLIQSRKVMVYLDDILIFGNDKKEHRKLVCDVLKRLEDNDLYAKAEKCFFEQSSIEYLGMIISHNSVKMDPKKVSGVLEWPEPKKVKHVQAFLGFANFYRRFIEGFAKLARPLSDLTKKEIPWTWGEDQLKAFEALKKAFTTAPILRIPDDENPFRLSTDASNFAIGAVLSQHSKDDQKWHPVAYFSKSLTQPERNYEIYDKEMLAIIRALEEYRHYLEGHPLKFEIWSDHQNLTYFKSAQNLTRRQARWALYLTRFNYSLHHKPGKTMQAEDPLSRRPDHEEGVNFDNRDQILLKPEHFSNIMEYFKVNALEAAHESAFDDTEILKRIKRALLSDKVTKDYHALLSSGPREFKKSLEEWNYENGLLLYRGKVYIPMDENEDLRREIVKLHHDITSAGHPGRWKTYELVTRNYWWPNMSIFVKNYVAGCDVCQRMKNRPQQSYGPLMPNKVPNAPWEIITVDLITQLPESDGFNAICVVVCRLTKRAHFFPITNEFSSGDLARLFYERIYPIHGLPLQIISDRGTQFAAALFQEWCKLLGIQSSMSTAYHPQTDGQTERVNQTLEQYLRCYVDYNLTNWSELLPTAEFAYNNQAHESTKNSPFFIEYGLHPRAGPTIVKETSHVDLNDIMKTRIEAQEQAKAALSLAAERMKWYFDKNVQKVPFKVGDLVLLNLKDYQRTERALQPRFEGPFEIIEKLSDVTFKLKLPTRFRAIHPVFHASKLAPYTQSKLPGQTYNKPDPVLVKGQQEYEVEKILQHRKVGRKIQYLVRWKGYGRDDDTWEPEANLKHAKQKIKEYEQSLDKAIRSITKPDEQLELLKRDSTLLVESNGGKLPVRGSELAAGLDLHANEDICIEAHSRALVSTGLKVKLPHGTYGRIAARSSLALKGYDIGAGVIDEDFRGEIKILLINTTSSPLEIKIGDRIAQLIIERIATVDIQEVETLDKTSRGDKGFGSTGL